MTRELTLGEWAILALALFAIVRSLWPRRGPSASREWPYYTAPDGRRYRFGPAPELDIEAEPRRALTTDAMGRPAWHDLPPVEPKRPALHGTRLVTESGRVLDDGKPVEP